MANVIKHKRGSGSDPVANNLVIGELAIRTDNGKLFTKMDSGAIAEIAGGGSDIAINTLSLSSATGGGSATFNGSAYRFTLSSPPSVSAAQLLVSVNGVIQKPVPGTGQPSEGFSVDGNDIIFGDAPATGADFFILTFRSLGVSEPAANSVTNAKVASNAAIDGTKITPSFTGNVSITNVAPKIFLTDSDTDSDFAIRNMHGVFGIHDQTNGATRLAILSNGLVGIGTTTPIEQLHIANPANCIVLLEDTFQANQVGVRYKTTTNQWIAGVHGGQGNTWKLSNSNTFGTNDYLTVGTNAAVGIAGFFTMTCVNPSIYFNETGSNPDYRLYNNSGSFTLKDTTNGVERLVVNSSGKVGINEVNPVEMLHIKAEDNTDSFGGLIIKANNNSVHMKYGWRGLDANSGGDIRFAVGGTEMMRVLSSGKVGLGRTSADEMLHILADDNSDGFGGLKIDANNGSINCKYGWLGVDGSNSFRIAVAGTERMRINSSGLISLATTTTANARLFVNPNVDGTTQRGITISGRKDVYDVIPLNFVHATNNSSAGSVQFTSTAAVQYVTTSDYRLKQDVVTLTDSITKLKQLNPVHFKWKDMPSVETDGFLAHEVQTIVPSAIIGEKDAVDKDGNIEPQQIDTSKLVPLLVAALQEAIGRIEVLEAK